MLVGQVKPNLDGPPGAGHGGCPGSAGVTHLISPLGPWPSPDPRTMARPGAAASRDERASRTSTVRRPDWTTDESQGPGTRFWARISGSDRLRVVLGGPQIASCGLG